jgi:pyrimidine operon attenuation protein/uracil phosphoribosyltransferase
MAKTNNIILTHQEIQHKIKRIAYQIYENNVEETDIILAGIAENGYVLAKKLKTELGKISDLSPILCKVIIDKKTTQEFDTYIHSRGRLQKQIGCVD